MTQPAVSNHLHALEVHFGVALLTRGRPLRATPAGECLAEHARRVLDGVFALEAEMARPHRPARTTDGWRVLDTWRTIDATARDRVLGALP